MCYKILTKNVIPCPDIKKYKKFLFVGAHGGDIEKGAGATVAKLVRGGKNVKFVITTDSAELYVRQNLDREKRAEIRNKETLCSAMILGVKEVEFLPFKFEENKTIDQVTKELLKVFEAYKPDVVFVCDPTTPNEILPDDHLTARAVEKAFLICRNAYLAESYGCEQQKIKAICYYNSLKNNYCISTIGYVDTKLQAIMAHSSLLPEKAYEKYSVLRSYRYLIKLNMLKAGFFKGKLLAEGFRVVSGSGTHNLPETNY